MWFIGHKIPTIENLGAARVCSFFPSVQSYCFYLPFELLVLYEEARDTGSALGTRYSHTRGAEEAGIVILLKEPEALTIIPPTVQQDQDAIDFTDNDISSLSNFPFSPRLRTLLLARNRITHIQPTLAFSIPNLTTIVLTSNNMAELADLDPLRNFGRLTHVTLLENPVTRKEVSLRLVDFSLPTRRGPYGA
jgi:hypothetical protein